MLLREVEQRAPREIRVNPGVLLVDELPRRRHCLVHLRAEEESQRLAGHLAVHHGPVEAALVAAIGERHEGVPDVDDEGVLPRRDGAPPPVHVHLQPADGVLVEDGQRRRVAMRAGPESLVGTLAGRVVVEPHYGVVPLEEAPVMAAADSQALAQDLHDLQRDSAHLLAVPRVHLPV